MAMGKTGAKRRPAAKLRPATTKNGSAPRGAHRQRVAHETDALVAAIGARLRGLRQSRKMTLLELAERTGLSSSMLSLLERGKAAPSIGTLVAIGSALGVSTAEILAGPKPPLPDAAVSRRADQPVHATPDGVQRRVLRSDAGHGVEISMVEFEPGTASAPRPTAHTGFEFGIAMEGTLEVWIGGQVFTLKAGDLVSYPSTEPHRIANPGKRVARAMWVNLRQG